MSTADAGAPAAPAAAPTNQQDAWLKENCKVDVSNCGANAGNGAPAAAAPSAGNGATTAGSPAPAGTPASAAPPEAQSLEERYLTALAKPQPDWQLVAELLNGFSTPDIQSRLGQIPDKVAQIYDGAVKNPRVGPNSNVAQLTFHAAPKGTPESSSSMLDDKYKAAVAKPDWQMAAEYLNGFNIEGIKDRLGNDPVLMKNLYDGAVANQRVGPNSNVAKLTEGGAEKSKPAGKPTIAVTADGEDFKITGSGFVKDSNVSIRGRQYGDGWAKERYYPVHSDGDGKIDCKVPGSYVCYAPGSIRFSGTNGHENKSDFSRVLWSDDVEATCLIAGPEKDKDKDKDEDDPESPDSPQRQPGKIYAGLRTKYGSVRGETVKYWIQDWKTNEMLVNGVKKGSGQVIWFNCECSGAPDTGKVWYWHEQFKNKNEAILTDGMVTDMLV